VSRFFLLCRKGKKNEEKKKRGPMLGKIKEKNDSSLSYPGKNKEREELNDSCLSGYTEKGKKGRGRHNRQAVGSLKKEKINTHAFELLLKREEKKKRKGKREKKGARSRCISSEGRGKARKICRSRKKEKKAGPVFLFSEGVREKSRFPASAAGRKKKEKGQEFLFEGKSKRPSSFPQFGERGKGGKKRNENRDTFPPTLEKKGETKTLTMDHKKKKKGALPIISMPEGEERKGGGKKGCPSTSTRKEKEGVVRAAKREVRFRGRGGGGYPPLVLPVRKRKRRVGWGKEV